MKKILYLIPLALLVLCATTLTLHKDTVSYMPGGQLGDLKPSYWKAQDYQVNANFKISQSLSPSDLSKAAEAYSQNAKFYGFPFGFYFSKSSTSSISSFKISAYSWLWATVDGLLILLALLIVFWFNRPRKDSSPTQTSAMNTQPPSPSSLYPTPSPPQSSVPTDNSGINT